VYEKSSCVRGRYFWRCVTFENLLTTAIFYCYFRSFTLLKYFTCTYYSVLSISLAALFSFHLTCSTLFIPNTARTQWRGTGYHRRCRGPTFVAAPEAPSEGRCGIPVRVCDGIKEFQRKRCNFSVSTNRLSGPGFFFTSLYTEGLYAEA